MYKGIFKDNKTSTSRSTSLRKPKLYLYVLGSIAENSALPKDTKQRRLDFIVNRLKKLNLISKVGYGTWNLTPKGTSFFKEVQQQVQVEGEKTQRALKPIGLDATLRISIPILKELENPYPSDLERKFKGWVAKYHYTSIPVYDIGLTIQKTPKNVIVYVHHLKLEDPEDLEGVVATIKRWTKEYFGSKRILLLDDLKAKTVYLKYGLHDPMTKKAVPKGQYTKVDLKRPRKKILPSDQPAQAKVWFDKTPFDYTVHSNDQTYVQRYLLMPETLANLDLKLVPAIDRLAQQIELHLDVQKDTKKVLGSIDEGINKFSGKVENMGEEIKTLNKFFKKAPTRTISDLESFKPKDLLVAEPLKQEIKKKKRPKLYTEAQAKAKTLKTLVEILDALLKIKRGKFDKGKMDPT